MQSLTSVQQRSDYHPEGTVFEHSMQALDAAARFDNYKNDEEKFIICLAALCHDLGKIDSTDEQLKCHGHELTGVPRSKDFISRFIYSPELITTVQKLVRYHLMPRMLLEQNSTPAAFKRLALKLAPQTTMRQLGIICLVDQQGRNGQNSIPLNSWKDSFKKFISICSTLNILEHPEPAVLQGKHIIDQIAAGPELGALLKKAYEIQIEENICDLELLKERILKKNY